MAVERTFAMLKPDTVQRKLAGEVIARFEKKGLKLVGMKLIHMDNALAGRLYEMHKGKGFFNELIKFATSGPVVPMVWEGDNAIAVVRKIIGKTNPQEAEPGSVRGDYAMFMTKNIVHASDTQENAKKEMSIFFTEKELVSYKAPDEPWLY